MEMNDPGLIERRKEERIVSNHNSIFIKLTFTYSRGHELVKPVNDISPSGVSFNMNEEEGYLLPGLPLKDIRVKGPRYEKVISNSVVRNCTRIDNAQVNSNRIGLEFLLKPFEKSSLRRKLLGSYGLRLPRYNSGLMPLLNWEVSFTLPRHAGHITTKALLNFSKFGIAFCLGQPAPILKASDVLYDLKAEIDGELIYEGEGVIADLQNMANGLEVRCSLRKGSLDLEKIFILNRAAQAGEEIKKFLSGFNRFEEVEPGFKAEVADLRHFLEKLEARLNREEDNLSRANIKEEYISYGRQKLLDRIFAPVAQRLDMFFDRLRALVSGFDQAKYDLYRQYFQAEAHQFFLKSPLGDRAYHKPLGYAGDYEIMNMVYKNPYAGENLFAKLINKHIWRQPGCAAVRNRMPYIIGKLDSLLNSPLDEDKKHFRVMSVGAGPAVEIQEMIRQNKYIERFIFTLIDADSDALLYCQEKLLNLSKEYGCSLKVRFIHEAIDQLIKDRNLAARLGGQGLIYALGLFDYLNLSVAQKLTERLYELLNSQGKLIIGNFSSLNTTKTYMEYMYDWYLFHRSEEEMLKFAEGIPNPGNIYFETESTRITNFLVIEK